MSGYNSFYGGRRGASFVIVKKYASIKEMVSYFQKGGDYKTVNYDEYVLIDTVSKNDADNGKIYRRGYEYTNELGGAIYVGQIVGPAGMAPHLELKTIKDVKGIAERDNFTYRRGEGSYAPSENLVPGKYKDSNGYWKYNDEIQWAYCSVRDENASETTAHIGFKFPYTVIDYTASSVDPYYNRSKQGAGFINEDLVERTDDGAHPFFEEWHISIPKGIKGDTFKNLKVVTADSSIVDYDGKADDIKSNRKIVVYEYYNYDSKEEGDYQTLYLGDYNMISGVSVADDGTLTISYTHNDNSVFSKKIRWVKNVSLNTENGQFVMNYNDGTKYETQLRYPKEVSVDGETGMFTMKYTMGDDYSNRLIYPTDIKVNTGDTEGEGNQKVNVTYTDGTSKDVGEPLNYIMKTACNKETAWHLYILYADPEKRGNIEYDGRKDWVDLGYIGNGELGCIASKEDDTTAQALADELPAYSTWLIIEEKEDKTE